jgi:hypothetical protein
MVGVSDVTPMSIVPERSYIGSAIGPTEGKFRRAIIGVTKDSTGAVLAGCTVEVLRTSDDNKTDSQVSDASGNYECSIYEDGPFKALAYKIGSPDVAGTTINTLTGV